MELSRKETEEKEVKKRIRELEDKVLELCFSKKTHSPEAYEKLLESFIEKEEKITSHNKLYRELQEREYRLQTIFDNTYHFTGLMEPDGTLIEANKTIMDAMGVKKEDVIGMYLWDLPWWSHSEELQDKVKNGVKEAGEGKNFCIEGYHTLLDGNQIYVEVILKPVKDQQGNVIFIIPEGHNITDRKKAEEELIKEKNFTEKIIRSLPGIFYIFDTEGNFLKWNKNTEKITGYTREEISKMTAFDFFTEEDIPMVRKDIGRVFEKGMSNIENYILTKERKKIPYYFSGSSIEIDKKLYLFGLAIDITEAKKASEKLKLYREIFINSKDPIAIISSEGFYIEQNIAHKNLIGYSDKELTGKTPAIHLGKEEFSEIGKNLKEKGIYRKEVISIKKSGEKINLDLTAFSIYDEKKKLICHVGIKRDITDRKRADEAIEKRIIALTRPMDKSDNIDFHALFSLNEIQHLQDLFAKATGVASIITAPDGTPITKPTNFCHLCKNIIRKTEKGLKNCYRSDAVLGKPNPRGPIVQPCLSGGLWDAGASISAGGKHIANWLIGQVRDETQTEENMLKYAREIGADEKEFLKAFREVPAMKQEQFKMVAEALFAVANQLSTTAYQNVQQARFITERKKGEEELRRLRNYLSNIINSMPSVLVGIDKEGKVTQWNREAERETGIKADEASGRTLKEVFPRLTEEIKNINKAIREKKSIQNSKRPRRTGTEIRYEELTIYPLITNGAEGAVILIDNVTDRVRMEELMIQSEKMLSVGGLAAGMAHEINNPLAGMMQNCAVMMQRLTRNLPANIRAAEKVGTTMETIKNFMEERDIPEMLEDINSSGRRAAEIVNNMLSFARKADRVVSSYSMAGLLDKTLALASTDYDLKKKYDFKQIKIKREYEDNLPPVPCETGKIQQVFLNIIRNGAEAIQENIQKDRQKEEPCFTLRIRKDNASFVKVEIEDNGPGMDEETKKRIFEPFFTTKPSGKGTGLGLSVSYFIITENHNGTISVESKKGEGTKFIIKLPLERK